ncbi:MAG TPA: thermonuclease family protein [Pyrinomonadaceae bacterium]
MYGKVIEVVDGDSIVIENLNRPVIIELMGIDAPELKQNCGELARQHLIDLIFNKSVAVEYFSLGENGAIPGKIFLDKMDVAAQMVRDGVAWYDKANSNRLTDNERQVYADSEQLAREEQRGIWQESTPLAPWEFRLNPTLASATKIPVNAESASSTVHPVRSLTNDDLGLERFGRATASHGSSAAYKSGDKVFSIVAKELFKAGPTRIVSVDAASAGELPTGYEFYEGYDIQSEAIAVGHDVIFKVASAPDQNVVASLRVLHLEQDDMQPTRTRWIDRTVPSPRNLEDRTVSASTNQLGRFVIAKKDEARIKNAPAIDLSVTTTASPKSVSPGETVRYTVNVQNKSLNQATEVLLAGIIDMRLRIISATSPNGVCERSRRSDDTVECALKNIAGGASAVVTVEAKLVDGGPVGVLNLNNTVIVRAKERQTNSRNPEAVINSTVRLAQ